MLAIIGGSGMSAETVMRDSRRETIDTPYGETSGPVSIGTIKGRDTVFLERHGAGHSIPPHEINYRANIWALKQLGVEKIIAVATVGAISSQLLPGELIVPHQIIDYSWGRRHTFFDAGAGVKHIDFTEPYSAEMRDALLVAAAQCGESVHPRGVYAVTQGPRLETAAEIDRFERDGADIVGMTAMPECVLARELELAYGAIVVVANHAAGRGDSRLRIDLDAIHAVHGLAMVRVARIIEQFVGAQQ